MMSFFDKVYRSDTMIVMIYQYWYTKNAIWCTNWTIINYASKLNKPQLMVLDEN